MLVFFNRTVQNSRTLHAYIARNGCNNGKKIKPVNPFTLYLVWITTWGPQFGPIRTFYRFTVVASWQQLVKVLLFGPTDPKQI